MRETPAPIWKWVMVNTAVRMYNFFTPWTYMWCRRTEEHYLTCFVLSSIQSEQQKKQQQAEWEHHEERKKLRRSAGHLSSGRGRGWGRGRGRGGGRGRYWGGQPSLSPRAVVLDGQQRHCRHSPQLTPEFCSVIHQLCQISSRVEEYSSEALETR